jgi:phosphinothricin acetyltransferase
VAISFCNPTIRRTETGDLPDVMAIWNSMIRETLSTFTTRLKTLPDLQADLETCQIEGWASLVADLDEEVVGFSTYRPFRGGPGYRFTMEHTIICKPTALRQGVGTALLAAIEAHASTEGHRSLIAGISGSNTGAIEFHRRHGFAQVGRVRDAGFKLGHWLDLVLMQKLVASEGVCVDDSK